MLAKGMRASLCALPSNSCIIHDERDVNVVHNRLIRGLWVSWEREKKKKREALLNGHCCLGREGKKVRDLT